MPHAPCPMPQLNNHLQKLATISVVQALHLKEIYVAPSALGVVFQ
ncbi:hypothetical protein [Nostoc sp.]